MLDVSIVNETSSEANWNRQTGRQTGRQIGKPMCWEAAPPKTTTKKSQSQFGSFGSPGGEEGFLNLKKMSELDMTPFKAEQ